MSRSALYSPHAQSHMRTYFQTHTRTLHVYRNGKGVGVATTYLYNLCLWSPLIHSRETISRYRLRTGNCFLSRFPTTMTSIPVRSHPFIASILERWRVKLNAIFIMHEYHHTFPLDKLTNEMLIHSTEMVVT